MEALKAELKKLQTQRSAIEADINSRSERLNEPGQPGISGILLDKEGFPRSDIDIHAVRTDRNAIVRLTNDHKQITSQLEQLLHKIHALARETGAVAASNGQSASNGAAAAAAAQQPGDTDMTDAAPAAAAAGMDDVALRPFAVVDEVADGSPAAAAGIQLGDQLCRFGAAVACSGSELHRSRFGAAVAGLGSELQQVAQELQAHEDQEVAVVFLRAGQAVQMQLTPRKWAGRGLLGCHLRPL